MGTIFGYARVSTKDQNSESQEESLRRAGCSRIYRDIASGALSDTIWFGTVPQTT